ncbi:MAG TPA: cupredoxin domain-containing protein [Chloroflexaceae bacterium]|nr:cupredoxin domain-containing protein [Chloroflexaceae bacterium]
MNITVTAPRTGAERQPIGFRALAVGSLIGFALLYVYIQVALIGRIEMPLPIFSAISLLLAGLVAGRPVGGWRWTPLLAAVWGQVLLFGKIELLRFHLAHPENTHEFAAQLVLIGLALTALVAGVGATAQNYLLPATERRLPRWVPWGFTALAGLLLGAVLVAAIPRAAGPQIDPAVLAQLPVVPLEVFAGGEIRVRAGEVTALRLENTDGAAHSFDVDELNVHVLMPGDSDSLALFKAETPGTYTFYCAPHYDKATGSGMHGTLIVEP